MHALREGVRRNRRRPYLGLIGRGVNSLRITDFNEPWGESDTCTSCGKCIQVCPTGALFEKGKVGRKCPQEAGNFFPT